MDRYLYMPISPPEVSHKTIQNNMSKCLHFLSAAVSENHVDGQVQIVGYLRNGLGAKIEITNLEEIQNHDIDEWSGIARDTGAINVNYVADFSAGKITFDIEYKRPLSYTKYCEWLIYPIALSILTASLKFL